MTMNYISRFQVSPWEQLQSRRRFSDSRTQNPDKHKRRTCADSFPHAFMFGNSLFSLACMRLQSTSSSCLLPT